MSKLSLNALKEKSEAVISQDLLNSISGGTENSCHTPPDERLETEKVSDGPIGHEL